MKRILLIVMAVIVAASAFSQTQTIYKFAPVNDIEITPVKDQVKHRRGAVAPISLPGSRAAPGRDVPQPFEMFVVNKLQPRE